MKTKLKVEIRPGIYAVLSLSLDVPAPQRAVAEAANITQEQLDNMVGQEMQSILALLGNSDEV